MTLILETTTRERLDLKAWCEHVIANRHPDEPDDMVVVSLTATRVLALLRDFDRLARDDQPRYD